MLLRRTTSAQALPVERVLDSTGAGDALAAGWIVGGPDLALEAAARCVQQLGAMPVASQRVSELIQLSDEVRTALDEGRPVVALETTIVAHGFPAPHGVEVGRRDGGRRARGGRDAGDDRRARRPRSGSVWRATSSRASTRMRRKVGPRDLAACAVTGDVGATTVGGVLAVARMVGIRFMGTGGIGGVHRGYPDARRTSPPTSSRSSTAPVLVACSGAKSLLDIPATMEHLETLGIPVLGYRTDTLPLFYEARAGRAVTQRVDDPATAARIAAAHWELGACGLLLTNPPPESIEVGDLIEEAVATASREGVSGQAVTPFVLAFLHERSDGRTREVNRKLAVANARLGRRGVGSVRRPVSLYDAVKDLPLELEAYDLDVRSLDVSSGFTRKTTTIRLDGRRRGGARRGRHLRSDRARRATRARSRCFRSPATWTIDSFSQHLAEQPLFENPPERDVYVDYRRWGFESAALDLALRQTGQTLGQAVGRELRPLTFVVSMRLGEPPTLEPRPGLARALPRRCASSSTRRATGRTSSSRELRELGCVDSIDFKGHYTGTIVDQGADPALYRRVIEGLPGIWLEDPKIDDGTRPILEEVSSQVTWDAIIHSVEDIEALPWPPKTVNVKPSRFGSIERLFARVRLLRGARDRRVRRRPVRARRRPRAHPVPRRALPSGHAERRRARRLQPARSRAGLPVEPAHGHAARDRLPAPL